MKLFIIHGSLTILTISATLMSFYNSVPVYLLRQIHYASQNKEQSDTSCQQSVCFHLDQHENVDVKHRQNTTDIESCLFNSQHSCSVDGEHGNRHHRCHNISWNKSNMLRQ